MGDSAYRGISADQDGRFRNKEQLLLKKLAAKGQFPDCFDERVNIQKVNMEVMRPWIAKKVEEVLGFEDDVVVEYVNGMLEDPNDTQPDPKKMQLSLTGFLESKTPAFMAELWSLLLSAQKSIGGIPQEFVEKKKEEMRLARERDAAAIAGSGMHRRQEGRSNDRQGNQQYSRPRFENRSNRSRWDDAPRSQNSSRDEFVDRRGNRTERVQDGGWRAQRSTDRNSRRSPSPPRKRHRSRTRSRTPPRYERQEKRSRHFDDEDSKDEQRRRYESHSDGRRAYYPRESESPPRRNHRRRSPISSPSRSPEARDSRSNRQAEGSVTPDFRDRQKDRPSPSLTPPRRRDERSPTYSPPGVQWDENDEGKSEESHSKQEAQSRRKGTDKLSRSRWTNDD